MSNNLFSVEPSVIARNVDSLLASSTPDGTKRFSLHVIEASDPEAVLALAVTAEVFGERFGDSPEELWSGYSKYISSMLHIVVIDDEARLPVGALSFIRRSPRELMTIIDIEEKAWDQPIDLTLAEMNLKDEDVCWDIATIAVPRRYAATPVAMALMLGMWVTSEHNGVTRWTAALDAPVLHGLQKLLGPIFSTIGGKESVRYFGSEATTAVTAHVPTKADFFSERMTRRSAAIANGQFLSNNFRFAETITEMQGSSDMAVVDIREAGKKATFQAA